jgi:hypothetical protein
VKAGRKACFFEKSSKKLLLVGGVDGAGAQARDEGQFFCFFFCKKRSSFLA